MLPLEIAAHWAWQTSLAASILIAPALLAAVLLRKPVFTPVRHILGFLVVARLLMPFAVPSPLSVFNWINAPSESTITLPKITPATTVRTTNGSPQNLTSQNKSISRSQPQSLLPMVWAFGVAAILVRVAWQHRRVRKWIAAGEQLTKGPAVEALRSALELAICRRTIRIYSAPGLKTPALFGLLRPSILLPRDLAESGDFGRLRLVCLHEIAHLRRLDVLINWFAIFAQALHWFNPFVWLTLRRLRADQELLCDADVIRVLHPNEHRAYGETLLALASPGAFTLSPLIPVSSNFKQLKERIAMIKQFKPITNRLLLFALLPLAAVLVIVTFTAAIQKRPAPAVVEKNVDSKGDIERREKGLNLLQDELDLQRARVRTAEAKVDELRKALGLALVRTESDLFASESETLKTMETERIRAEQEYIQMQELWKSLKSKPRDAQIRMMPTSYHDVALDSLLDSLNKAEQQLVVLQKDYGDEHQEVQRLIALIKTINRQMDSRVAGIMEGLEALVSSRRSVTDSLQKQVTELKFVETERAEKARPYFEAMRDLEIQRKLLETVQIRLTQERFDISLESR